ncbi:MAG: PKD domain-containing protein [Crocinitomicaceae bacterium]
MKTNFLTSLGFSMLAFMSIGQTRSTGVNAYSINEVSPQQHAYQQYNTPRTESARTPNTFVNRAPCIDTLLFEDFQSETISGSWINLDLDMNADANGRPQDWYISFEPQSTLPNDTNWVATSSSWFTPFGTANNVLILDAVQPCASTILRWDSAPFEGLAFMDGYEVRISTTGTNIADFTTTLFTAAESVNGTTTPSAGTVHSSFNGNNGTLQTWEVSLGAYDNQTVYIAFFHDSNDDNLIQIDNIFMGLNTDFDMEVADFSTEPYYSTPLPHVTPRTFSTDVTLANGAPVTTPTADVTLFQGATSVFTNAPNATILNAGDTVTLTTSAYTPLAIDTYQAFTNVSAVETDPNFLNNIDSLMFVVSDSVYATADTTIDGALSIGAGNSGILGNQYNVLVADDLTSITFTLTAPTVGDTVVGVVYNMSGATPNQLIAATDTLIITSANTAAYTLPIIGGALSLTPGNYFVGIQEGISAGVTLATNNDYFVEDLSWVFFNGNWGNNEDFGFQSTFLLNANFACPTVVPAYTESSTQLTVDFTDASVGANSWLWDFGDGNTSTQQNPTHTYAADGTYTVCLTTIGSCDADSVCSSVTVTSCANPTADFTESINVGVVDFTNTSSTSGTPTYSWDFGDGQSSTVENPTNTYAANGTYTVCLTVSDSCGVDTLCNTVDVSTIGIDENNLIDQLSIYPVPVQEIMTISNLTSGEDFKLELLNNLGQIVKVVRSEGLETVQLDLSTIVDGYYHVRISNSTIVGTRAVLIKH